MKCHTLPRVLVPVRICRRSVNIFTKYRSSPSLAGKTHTLHETRHDLATGLQQRMADHNLEKPLQSFPPMLNHIVGEPVREDLARQRRYRDARRLPLQHVAEVLEVAVPPAHRAVLELERWDVRHHVDLVVGVHVSAGAVCAGIADLRWSAGNCRGAEVAGK